MADKPKKRSVVIAGHPTSLSIEDDFWAGLKDIAKAKSMPLSTLIDEIDKNRDLENTTNLSSAIRLYVYRYAKNTGSKK